MKAPGKKVAVLGLGKTGLESALFLHQQKFEVFVSEALRSEVIETRAKKLQDAGIQVETGGHSLDQILSSHWVLISPGISPNADIVRVLQDRQIPLFSEIEVASWFTPTSKIIAVTGTSGKTTVTTLMTRILEAENQKVVSCGNIGNPWIAELSSLTSESYVVLELSSFQLAFCQRFRPFIGLLLNISPNHQDWHKDMEDYVHSKLRLFQSQQETDHAIVRRRDQEIYFPEYSFSAKLDYFGSRESENPNEEAVRAVAQILSCKKETVDRVLETFEGLEHRLEIFLKKDGITFVNDSKCTTTSSLAWALDKFKDKSVILIAGGKPKSDDYHTIRHLVGAKVKEAILIGEARVRLKKAWDAQCPLFEAGQFSEAVERALSQASGGDTVLLSPACASFDMFQNYQDRGNLFKKYVLERTQKVPH